MNLEDLQQNDRISIDREPLSGVTFRVSDVEMEDIGLTKIVSATILTGCEPYVITQTADSTTVQRVDGDESWDVDPEDITVVEEA